MIVLIFATNETLSMGRAPSLCGISTAKTPRRSRRSPLQSMEFVKITLNYNTALLNVTSN